MKYNAQDLNRPHYVRLQQYQESFMCVIFIPILLDEGCAIAYPGSPGGLGVLVCLHSPPAVRKNLITKAIVLDVIFFQYLHQNDSCNLV